MSVHDAEKYDRVKKALGIPLDEPIFVLRAQDKFAPAGIRNYRNVVRLSQGGGEGFDSKEARDWDEEVTGVSQEFLNWQEANRDKVKRPD